jgi:hypothetical protein
MLTPPQSDVAGVDIHRAAIEQNGEMRQELAHVGNLISDLARAMNVDTANKDGTWPDLSGRIEKLILAARQMILAASQRNTGDRG